MSQSGHTFGQTKIMTQEEFLAFLAIHNTYLERAVDDGANVYILPLGNCNTVSGDGFEMAPNQSAMPTQFHVPQYTAPGRAQAVNPFMFGANSGSNPNGFTPNLPHLTQYPGIGATTARNSFNSPISGYNVVAARRSHLTAMNNNAFGTGNHGGHNNNFVYENVQNNIYLTEPSNGATVDPPHPVPANDMEYGNAGMQQDHNFGTVPADSTAGAAPTPNFVPEDTNDEPEMTAPAPPERGRGRGRPRTRLQGQDAQPCGLAPLAPSRAHSVDRWDGIRTDVAPPLVRSRRSTDPVPIQRTPACLRR